MKSNESGFAPVVLIIIFGIVLLTGTGYVAYEVGKGSQPSSQENSVENNNDVATTTTDTEIKKENTQDTGESSSIIDSLKKELDDLKAKVNSTPKTTNIQQAPAEEEAESNILTLPNGAVVEMDENGNILRYIKQPTVQSNSNKQQAQETSGSTQKEDVEISSLQITTEIYDARIEWETNRPTNSKIFISGGNYASQVFQSESGLSTRHFVNLTGFNLKNDVTYSYEIEAIETSESEFVKKTGTFKLLSRAYDDVLAEIQVRINFNPQLSCLELYPSKEDEFIVCLVYRAGI